MVFSWKNGRLASSVTTADKNLSFLYDRNGLRVRKTVKTLGLNTSVEHHYDYAGGNLIRESYGDTQLWFMYDESGSPVGFRRQVGTTSTPYYYVKNIQGDIVAIARGGDGAILARYAYDAWGNILSITDNAGHDISNKPNEIANINPLRYRGYYYDSETGLYYLKSRFYDPATGRFVNADGCNSTGQGLLSSNMYIYCYNNPIIYKDSNGMAAEWILDGIYYSYDGSAGDFVRLEHGLPPGDYSRALQKKEAAAMSESHKFTQMAICTDGTSLDGFENAYGSSSYQSTTAYTINEQGKTTYMDPAAIRYVVAPVYYSGVKDGDLAVVIDHSTNKHVYAIVGDRGNPNKFNEVSLKVAWDLGYTEASGRSGPKGNFEVIYFPNTAVSWASRRSLIASLDLYGREYY